MSNLNQSQLRKVLESRNMGSRYEALHTAKMERGNVRQLLAASDKKSRSDLSLTSKTILLRSVRGDVEEAGELTKWALGAKPASRRTVVSTFIKNKQSAFLVHQIAKQKRADAATLMKDYFQEGGSMKDVAEWLCEAGEVLKMGPVPDGTDNLVRRFGSAVGSAAGTLTSAIAGAINTVADAIKAAGKNLAEAVSAVVGWTQSKINNFVEAILKAGEKVGDILSEAVKRNISTLNQFIQAVMEAGRQGLEVLNWAFNKAANVLNAALRRLEQYYGSLTTLIIEIAKMATSRLASIVRGLINMGKQIRDIIRRLDRIAYSVAIRIVQEIRNAANRSIRDIINAVATCARNIVRIAIDALTSISVRLRTLFNEVVNWTHTQLVRFIGALKDMGTTLSSILDEIARLAQSAATKFMRALRAIWRVLKVVLEFIATKAESIIHKLLIALLGTGVHISNVLRNILVDLRAAYREGLIKGLIQTGRAALTLLKEAAKISASALAVLFAIIMELTGTFRGLNPVERGEAEKIFGASIDLDRVKLTDASISMDIITWLTGLVKRTPKAFVTMYIINFKPGDTLQMNTLIHELTHIWQAENSGGVYMLEALFSQFCGEGYNLTDQHVQDANGKIENLEREQQAVLVEEYWKREHGEAFVDVHGENYGGANLTTRPNLSTDLITPLAKQVYRATYRFNAIKRVLDLDVSSIVRTPMSSIRPVRP